MFNLEFTIIERESNPKRTTENRIYLHDDERHRFLKSIQSKIETLNLKVSFGLRQKRNLNLFFF